MQFYAESNFDTELRKFCKDKGIWYQSFWTLTANRRALASQEAKEMAEQKGLPSSQTLMFAFLMSLGYVTPLSGTTDPKHMVGGSPVFLLFYSARRRFPLILFLLPVVFISIVRPKTSP